MGGACKENKEAYSILENRECMINNGNRISSRGHQIRTPASLVVVDSPMQGYPKEEGGVVIT